MASEPTVPLDSLFTVQYGTQFDLKQMEPTRLPDPDAINFVSRSRQNLGVAAYVKPYLGTPPLEAGLITVALGGSYLLSAFIQERPFYTAQNVAVLTPKADMSFTEKLFYCLCLERNRFRYSAFGREANRTLASIRVPERMPNSFRAIQPDDAVKVSTKPLINSRIRLSDRQWRDFRLDELFAISGTKTTPVAVLEAHGPGPFPYVTTQTTNNGVGGFYDYSTERGNVLTVDSAVAGFCSFQRHDFSASDHVEKLVPLFKLNPFTAVFLTTVINLNQIRYSYGRKASQERLGKTHVKLPVTDENVPDWMFIERFVQSLPYSASL